ncbi:DUF423 domain-containing protein [Devosia nitrariae]|uniref:DUF423 domain-containing protein n=2 Tax=Devosia nitrariae TaxID=2071872 RepID=A0ABQ5W3Z2_9HYPH|nr:DUF423 domain-containing protein [Devosia nitrariae]
MLAAAGFLGAAGILAAAGSAHAGASQMLISAALVCLAHAPALLALALGNWRSWLLTLAAGLLAVGTLVFAADMGVREFAGGRILPQAAPIGGTLMIGGWLCVIAGGIASLWQSRTGLP